MVKSILIIVIVGIILYFVYTKFIATPGSSAQKQATVDSLNTQGATISQAQALTIADQVYSTLNSIWYVITSGDVEAVETALSPCQGGADWNLVCQQFGTRSYTDFYIPVTSAMTMPEFMQYVLTNEQYAQVIAPFQNTGGLV